MFRQVTSNFEIIKIRVKHEITIRNNIVFIVKKGPMNPLKRTCIEFIENTSLHNKKEQKKAFIKFYLERRNISYFIHRKRTLIEYYQLYM